MSIAKDQYGYNYDFPKLFGINLFTLSLWTFGLFAGYLLHTFLVKRFGVVSFLKQVGLFLVMYWTLLIAIETLAFHVLIIRNVATSMYPGLPICDCIHVDTWMKIAYFSNGPIYFVLYSIFRRRMAAKVNLQEKLTIT